jgi:septum site-determining protein MinC
VTERGRVASSPLEQPTPPAPAASIKGGPNGLKVVVRSDSPTEVAAALSEQLDAKRGRFFEGEQVVLELDGDGVNGQIVSAVCGVLAEHGITLVTVTSAGSAPQKSAARDRSTMRAALAPPPGGEGAESLVVERTLRSGQEIIHPGTVVVLGDVNPGARVQAGGHVVVWGRLRGVVEAGLSGDDAVVCALELSPTQLRIGSVVTRAPDEARPEAGPEVARQSGGAILVEPWS